MIYRRKTPCRVTPVSPGLLPPDDLALVVARLGAGAVA
jgi:hypothetical protein